MAKKSDEKAASGSESGSESAKPGAMESWSRLMGPEWFGRMWPDALAQRFPELLGGDSIRVEEYRDGDTMVVRAELPDVDPDEDIEITVDKDRLVIRAERSQRTETKDKSGFRSEFRYGSFQRVVPLPAGAGEEDVSATYRDGVLEVRIPVDQERARAVKVPISR